MLGSWSEGSQRVDGFGRYISETFKAKSQLCDRAFRSIREALQGSDPRLIQESEIDVPASPNK